MPTTPTPPARLRIGHVMVDVRIDQAHMDAESVAKGVSAYAGLSRFSDQTIFLAEAMGPDYARDTLLHEVLHLCLRAVNIDPDADAKAGLEDVEERAVGGIAGVLVAVLRDNPAFVTYLLAGNAVGDESEGRAE